MTLAFAGTVDWAGAAATLVEQGRVQVRNVLESAAAESLATALAAIPHWDFALTDARQGPFKLPHDELARMPPQARARMAEDLRRQSRAGFAFAYYRRDVVPGDQPVLPEVASWIASPGFLEPMRRLTGNGQLTYSDAHATRYEVGSFLKRHDDTYAGRQRRYAWVLNLTRRWDPDWGGLLHFEADGEVTACFMPRFNSLSVFAVPQAHHVSQVASYALHPRDAVTGWLFEE
ncbi:MAG: 2OG-Fe(II) oxygenase family protein [Pseudomonadota bacterium]